MACSRGLFFADVNEIGEIKVTLNTSEVYFREQDVKSAIEFKRDMVVTCMDMDMNIYIIDRKAKTIVRTVENPSGSDNPLCMRLIPQFDLDKLPFALVRDKDGITFVNLKTATAYRGLYSLYQQLPFPQMLLDVQKSADPTSAMTFFVLEFTGRDSALVKYDVSHDFLSGLRLMVKNDM